MIYLKITQRKVPIDRAALTKDLEKILHLIDYPDFALGVWITNNATIREYNREYRKKDKATDILSFPAYPDLKAGERIVVDCCEEDSCGDGKELGDLMLSAEYIMQAAQELGVSFEERLRVLLVHGICHLLGYDHIEDDDYKKMQKKEIAILKKLAE